MQCSSISIHGEKSLLVCTEWVEIAQSFRVLTFAPKLLQKDTKTNVKPSSTANVRANLKYCFVRREIVSRFPAKHHWIIVAQSLAASTKNSQLPGVLTQSGTLSNDACGVGDNGSSTNTNAIRPWPRFRRSRSLPPVALSLLYPSSICSSNRSRNSTAAGSVGIVVDSFIANPGTFLANVANLGKFHFLGFSVFFFGSCDQLT